MLGAHARFIRLEPKVNLLAGSQNKIEKLRSKLEDLIRSFTRMEVMLEELWKDRRRGAYFPRDFFDVTLEAVAASVLTSSHK